MSFNNLSFGEMCTLLVESLQIGTQMANREEPRWDYMTEENEFIDQRWTELLSIEVKSAVQGFDVMSDILSNGSRNDLRGFEETAERPGVAKPVRGFGTFSRGAHSCESCENIDKLTKLSEIARSCTLHNIILSSVKRHNLPLDDIRIFVEPPSLNIDGDTPRLFAAASSAAAKFDKRNVPILPEAGSERHLLLLDTWLRECDSRHSHFDSTAILPTRVVEVEHPEGPNFVRVRETNGSVKGRYIALSHRWRDNTLSSATTTNNLDDHREAIRLKDLPQTFQDAVYIARNLHVRFIWIDSLCILQDSEDDWNVEAVRMREVYASAYLTIAATAAEDGLFIRTGEASGECKATSLLLSAETFERDLQAGELNERGWVLQERCLSHRTIHFTAAQTYWECESAIWCEAVGREAIPSKEYSSFNFSHLPSHLSLADARYSIHNLFERYSGLNLTKQTDRPMAVFGLEVALATSRKSGSIYGIFREFFPLGLLWQRSGDRLMQPIINFDRHPSLWSFGGMNVPSWSYMGYSGAISYTAIPGDDFRKERDLRVTVAEFLDPRARVLAGPIKRISERCYIKPCGATSCEVRDEFHNVVGWARYDYEYELDVGVLACLYVGRGSTDWGENGAKRTVHYVLLVKPISFGGDIQNAYRRLGVAAIYGEHIFDESGSGEGLIL